MNDFDRRWQAGVALARKAAARSGHAPAGFAIRVLARWRCGESISWTDAWFRLSVRTLAGASAVLAILMALEWRQADPTKLRFPHIEHSVAQVFWIL